MDRLGEAGADVVAAPLGAHPAVLEVILDRAREASSQG
jgi:sirohydrochlorin ferrochelatase